MYNDRHRGKSGLPAQKRQMSIAGARSAAKDMPTVGALMISSLIGVLVSALAGIILTALLSFCALGSRDPLSMIAPLSLLALLPSNFLGGIICSRGSEYPPLACGAICAAMWMLLSLITALCLPFSSSDHSLFVNILLHTASALFYILGAFAARYKPRRSKKKRRFGR